MLKCHIYITLVSICIYLNKGIYIESKDYIDNKVSIDIYFRSYCPPCRWLIVNPINELYKDKEIWDIINLKLIPAAGMATNGSQLICLYGEKECVGNKWTVCIVDHFQNDSSKYMRYLPCFEKSDKPAFDDEFIDFESKIKECFNDPNTIMSLYECYRDKSYSILREQISYGYTSTVQWMPYVIVGGKVIGNAQSTATITDILPAICNVYKGTTKPKKCQEINPVQITSVPASSQNDMDNVEAISSLVDEQNPYKVRFIFTWRAFCPACAYSLKMILPQLFALEGMSDIIDFVPLPCCDSSYDETEDLFRCTSGTTECDAHRILTCALDIFPEYTKSLQYITCLEDSERHNGKPWSQRVESCFQGSEYNKLKICINERSKNLLRKCIGRRVSLVPWTPWMPYVIVNDKVLGSRQAIPTFDEMVDAICQEYTGPKKSIPNICVHNENLPISHENINIVKPCPERKPKVDNNDEVYSYPNPPDIGDRGFVTNNEKVNDISATLKEAYDVDPISSQRKLLGPLMVLGLVVALIYVIFILTKKKDKKWRE